jgi:hypothetical protein
MPGTYNAPLAGARKRSAAPSKEVVVRRVLPIVLSLVLTGCGALPIGAPASAPDTQTPAVIIQTVVVTAAPTEAAAPAPTQPAAAAASPQVIVVTATGSSGEASPSTTAAVGTLSPADATAPFPANPGGDLFTNLTRSGDKFSLRCQPDTLSFGVSTSNVYVTGVDFWYRIQDRLSTSISNWQFGGSMESDKHGNFTIAFPASRVDPDTRSHRAWFDYQFIGVNKVGDVVGRSAKLAKQITYTIDCDD